MNRHLHHRNAPMARTLIVVSGLLAAGILLFAIGSVGL